MGEVEHNAAKSKFEVTLPNGEKGLLQYRLQNNSVDFYHTFVPTAARGQGIAGKLALTGLAWARRQGYKIIPTCSYIASYIQKEQEAS